MNVHKFNVKPKYGSHKTIKWLIPRDVKTSHRKNKYEYMDNFLSRKYYIIKVITINFRRWFHDERRSCFSLPR